MADKDDKTGTSRPTTGDKVWRPPKAPFRRPLGPVPPKTSEDESWFSQAMRRAERLAFNPVPELDRLQGLLVQVLTEVENLKRKCAEADAERRATSK